MNSEEKLNKKYLFDAIKCLNTILSKSDEYTKDVLHLGGINNRHLGGINNRDSYTSSLVNSDSLSKLNILIINFIKKIKTSPDVVNALENFIREINENGVPKIPKPIGTIPSYRCNQRKLQFERIYIELMGAKLTNFTQGFNAHCIYVLRSHSTGIEITPNIETILEMYKNIAECYYNLAINIINHSKNKNLVKVETYTI